MAEELTYQQVMQMFAETDRRMREGYERLQAGHERLQEGFEELKEGDKRLQRGHERLQAGHERLQEEYERLQKGLEELKEGDKRLQKRQEIVQRNIDKMSKEITRLRNLFESQWSRLIEALVGGKLVKLLKERGIDVNRITTNVEGNYQNRQYEFDILAVNGSELVVVEVKSRLQVQDVKELLEELKQFKTWVPEYRDKKIYGAVAYLRVDENAIKYAENQGLFVIKAVGDSASMINSSDFRPRSW